MTRRQHLPWSDEEARGRSGLDLLVVRSNLLGQDPTIVNWKGGNTSAKVDDVDHTGNPVRVLWVKGSGSDLRTMTSKDFVGLRLDEILLLQRRKAISDEEMVQYLGRCALRPDFPGRPSKRCCTPSFRLRTSTTRTPTPSSPSARPTGERP